MKLLNKLGVKLGLMTKPKFSELLAESVQKSVKPPRAAAESEQESIATPVFNKLVESAAQDQRARFLEAITSVSGPIRATELREFPTSDCLRPEEVYEKGDLGTERLEHLQQCSWCQTMVSGSHTSAEEAAAWIRNLESKLHTRERVTGGGQRTL
jgi:hypothetical protein